VAGSGTAHLRPDADIVLSVEHLVVEYPVRRRRVLRAVSDVSFDVVRGETLGIVGESGCGKTTTARAVIALEPIASGAVKLHGESIELSRPASLRRLRRSMQMIFQDPISSLNPRRQVRDLVREGLVILGEADRDGASGRVEAMMHAVGLEPTEADHRRPHELSGGQCQRICIARALVMDPDILILDEPVSALDVSVQAQILNLLESLKDNLDFTMVFISHDLSVVKNVSDRIMVMYLGKVCEVASSDETFASPAHPYTRALLSSIPGNELGLPPASQLISGELPSALDPPAGCRFRTRCPAATDRCLTEEPELRLVAGSADHFVACHHPHVD
jgi:peptide/nickel transport system ATP-binding protein